MTSQLTIGQDQSAVISPCGRYRYRLWRRWDAGPTVLWVMLNPSTADATTDDPTIRKCIGFARRWGAGRIDVVNLFAYRATNPRDLPADPDYAAGPENDYHVRRAVGAADTVVAAWGANATEHVSAKMVALLSSLWPLKCLGRTKSGQPRHPLMLPYWTRLEVLV